MYNETYEDYIRSILGYPNYGNNTYRENSYQTMPVNYGSNQKNEELEACYPEIYKVIYPMVNKACMNNTKPVTSALIDELTNEIYLSIESDNEINVTINLTNEVGGSGNTNRTTSTINSAKAEKVKENRGEDRQFRNRGLQDLIRILLIRELLGRPGRPGNRPPMPPHRPPMRPPFPGGGPGSRPPIMPRDVGYNMSNFNLYEE